MLQTFVVLQYVDLTGSKSPSYNLSLVSDWSTAINPLTNMDFIILGKPLIAIEQNTNHVKHKRIFSILFTFSSTIPMKNEIWQILEKNNSVFPFYKYIKIKMSV